MTLLHIDSSAGAADDSVSRRLTGLFAQTWRAHNGTAAHRHRDLAADPVPPLRPAYATSAAVWNARGSSRRPRCRR